MRILSSTKINYKKESTVNLEIIHKVISYFRFYVIVDINEKSKLYFYHILISSRLVIKIKKKK